MCEELRLRKLDSEAWGFRLTGGRDFGTPLTVLRVTGAGVAEEAGMEAGDMIISINGASAAQMTHVEAQQHIIGAGSGLTLQILRGSPVPALEVTTTPLRGMTPSILRCESELTNDSSEPLKSKSPLPHFHHFIDEREKSPTEDDLTEQMIAEKMLENAELLEGNVIGVNFKRFIPKVDFIKNSLVYQVLQEEQVYQAKTEEEQLEKCPEKRFSTFLVHPNNVKPKGKREAAHLAKRPKTLLLPEPAKPEKTEEEKSETTREQKTDGNPAKVEETPVTSEEKSADPTNTNTEDIQMSDPIVEEPITDSNDYIDFLITDQSTPSSVVESTEIIQIEIKSVEIVEYSSETAERQSPKSPLDPSSPAPLTKQEILNAQQELPAIQEVQEENEEPAEDTEFNKQLGLIKTQLASLRQLPSLIETQLNLFQTQIDCLVELKHKETRTDSGEKGPETKPDPSPADCQSTGESLKSEPTAESASESAQVETSSKSQIDSQSHLQGADAKESQEESEQTSGGQDKQTPLNGCECSEHLHHDNQTPPPKPRPKKSSLFNGITPQPRPVVLPGGRIWRKPQDAYNEEFIAETIVSQAEVLIGTQTGVNFRKYEPPKFSMYESAVWRLINNIENNTEEDVAGDFYKTPIDEKKIFVAGLHMNPDVEAVVREVEVIEAIRNAPPVNNHHVEVVLGQEAISSF